MPTKHVVLPGGSGFLGRSLTARLTSGGDRVTILTRGDGVGSGIVARDVALRGALGLKVALQKLGAVLGGEEGSGRAE